MRSPEQELWAASMIVKIEDAAFPFDISKDIDEQYRNYIKNPETIPSFLKKNIYISKGMHFMETSNFDDVAEMVGYGSEFVKRSFALVQKCVSYRKKLKEKICLT